MVTQSGDPLKAALSKLIAAQSKVSIDTLAGLEIGVVEGEDLSLVSAETPIMDEPEILPMGSAEDLGSLRQAPGA